MSGVTIVVSSRSALRTKRFAFDSQQTALIVGQQDPLLAHLFQQRLDLIVLKLDHFLLPVMDPAGEDDQQELPRLQNEVHQDVPVAESGRIVQHPGKTA